MRVGEDQRSSVRPCPCSALTLRVSVSGRLCGLRFWLPYVPANAESPDGWAKITTSKLSPGPLSPCSVEASESSDLTRSPGEPASPVSSLATVRPSASWCEPEVRALFSSPLSICWTRKNPSTVTTTTQITSVVAATRSWRERCQRRRIRAATTRDRRSSDRRAWRVRGGRRRPARRTSRVTRDRLGGWPRPRPGSTIAGSGAAAPDPGSTRPPAVRLPTGIAPPGLPPPGIPPLARPPPGRPPAGRPLTGSPPPRGPRPASLLLAAPSIALLHADREAPGPADRPSWPGRDRLLDQAG